MKRLDIDWRVSDLLYECKDGVWCRYEDVEKLEQENAALKNSVLNLVELFKCESDLVRPVIMDEVLKISKTIYGIEK